MRVALLSDIHSNYYAFKACYEDAVKYVSHYNTEMPAVWVRDAKLNTLPGFSFAGGIPFAVAVDAKGNVLGQGAATHILQWKTMVK